MGLKIIYLNHNILLQIAVQPKFRSKTFYIPQTQTASEPNMNVTWGIKYLSPERGNILMLLYQLRELYFVMPQLDAAAKKHSPYHLFYATKSLKTVTGLPRQLQQIV